MILRYSRICLLIVRTMPYSGRYRRMYYDPALCPGPDQPQVTSQGRVFVIRSEKSPFLESRHEMIEKVFDAGRQSRRHQVEPVSSFIHDPVFQVIGNLFGCAHYRAVPAPGGKATQQLANRGTLGFDDPQYRGVPALGSGKLIQGWQGWYRS